MYTAKVIGYEDIIEMQDEALMSGENITNEMLFDYCGHAIVFVDRMAELGINLDFSDVSLENLTYATSVLYADEKRGGLTNEDALYYVRERLTGYMLFVTYNRMLKNGRSVSFRANKYKTALCVVDGNVFYDINDVLDKLFDIIDFDKNRAAILKSGDVIRHHRRLVA